ncbi:MAG: hypothetical protein V1861_01780 [Candidatus Micrarchaeota archaeon]
MPREKSYYSKRDDGKHTVVLIGILLILIVIIGAALISILTKNGGGQVTPIPPINTTPQPPDGTNTTNETPITPTCNDQCLFDLAVSEQNASACAAISMSNLSQSCFERLSEVSLDACKEVKNLDKLQVCVTSFAVAQKNISLCDILAQGKDQCMLSVDPCFNASDKNLCKALNAGDPSLCAKDTQCLLNYSMEKKDSDSCSLISDNVVSTACRSAVQYSDKCSSLPADATRDYCYMLFAIYSGDYLTCTQISSNSMYMLDCLSFFAITLGNYTVCDADQLGLNERWACYSNYSLQTGDLSGCQNIDELATTNRFKCSFEYAKKYGDPSACQLIDSQASRNTCYEGAIIYSSENLDYTKCQYVTSFVWQNKCYTESAKLYNDKSLCEQIGEEFAKETCRNAYDANQTSSS